MPDVALKPASTVVLCLDDGVWPPKILLIKRSAHAKFLPGAHVFPGGKVDPKDYREESSVVTAGVLERVSKYFVLDSALVQAHIEAAIREVREEAGVEIMPDNLWPISWWVTPQGEVRRFDTWFFLATISGQVSKSQYLRATETSEPLWLRPADALDLFDAGDIFLAPPTRAILQRMATAHSLQHLLSLVEQPLVPIHPLFVDQGERKLLALPGHELHPNKTRSSFIMKTSYFFDR